MLLSEFITPTSNPRSGAICEFSESHVSACLAAAPVRVPTSCKHFALRCFLYAVSQATFLHGRKPWR